MFTMPSAPQ